MPPVRIVIPGRPLPNLRARSRSFFKDGDLVTTHYTPEATRTERNWIRSFAARVMDGQPLLAGALDFRATYYRPVPASWSKRKRAAALAGEILPTSKPDLDNLEKMIDALAGIVWRDDAAITDKHTFKRYAERPRTVIEVRPVHVGR